MADGEESKDNTVIAQYYIPVFEGAVVELRFWKPFKNHNSEMNSYSTLGLMPDSLKTGPMITLFQRQGTVAIS